MLRIIREHLHPTTQLRLMYTKVLRGLGITDAALLNQPHRLMLELACKLPPLHDPPPVPLKHLTRCLRNRVQASLRSSSVMAALLALVRAGSCARSRVCKADLPAD